jgi:AcrR family transcriptional regulator
MIGQKIKNGRMTMKEVNTRKQRIIDAAILVMQENPMEEVTVRKIANKAGLTTGAIYHHYKNKDELLFDVIKQSLQFTHRLAESVKNENHKKGRELLEEIASEVGTRLSKSEEQKLYILLLMDAVARNHPVRKKYEENYRAIIENTANLFEESFEIKNDTYKRGVAALLVAAMDGIAIQQALGVLPDNQEMMTETFVTFFQESISTFLRNHQG